MNQVYLLSPHERIRNWKEFREVVSKINKIEDQLLEVQLYWQSQPIVDRYLDIDSPNKWPGPWELIHEGMYCPVAKAYLMEQTLLMVDNNKFTSDKFVLSYIQNKDISKDFMALIFDNKYVLNYSHNMLEEYSLIQEDCIVLQSYTPSNDHKHSIKQ